MDLSNRGSLTHDRSPSVLSAEAFEAALAGVEQALPVAAPLRRTALMTAVTALLSRSPSKVQTKTRNFDPILLMVPVLVAAHTVDSGHGAGPVMFFTDFLL